MQRDEAELATRGIPKRRSAKGYDDELYAHIDSLRRYAKSLVGNTPDADDLVQEALKRALTYGRNGTRIRDLRAYLFTVLHNVRTDQLTRQTRLSPTVSLAEIPFDLPYPASQHRHVELIDLARALRHLPQSQRQLLLLVGVEGLSYQDAAAMLEIPVGTVMSRLSRARRELRRLMKGHAVGRRPGEGRITPRQRPPSRRH